MFWQKPVCNLLYLLQPFLVQYIRAVLRNAVTVQSEEVANTT